MLDWSQPETCYLFALRNLPTGHLGRVNLDIVSQRLNAEAARLRRRSGATGSALPLRPLIEVLWGFKHLGQPIPLAPIAEALEDWARDTVLRDLWREWRFEDLQSARDRRDKAANLVDRALLLLVRADQAEYHPDPGAVAWTKRRLAYAIEVELLGLGWPGNVKLLETFASL